MAKEVSLIARALELSVIVRELMDLQVADEKHIAMGVSGRAQKAALGFIGMRNRNSSSNKIKDEKNVTLVERIVESLIVPQSQW